ncbi:hypothetical protein T01_4557 [Trichinella spiralis]|uniref:Uncharacterized protein n=1 Tax=Trichinella spiralis TaxID=6334 RepID=A0A0V1AH94_TRISP|nr:hypothetical protein T01_10616 [Trichinella spiralis]KRY24046.1 hypothetical protein T01_4557 [Trichinella spiralis]
MSSYKHFGIGLSDCMGCKDNAGGVQLLCQSTTLQMDL